MYKQIHCKLNQTWKKLNDSAETQCNCKLSTSYKIHTLLFTAYVLAKSEVLLQTYIVWLKIICFLLANLALPNHARSQKLRFARFALYLIVGVVGEDMTKWWAGKLMTRWKLGLLPSVDDFNFKTLGLSRAGLRNISAMFSSITYSLYLDETRHTLCR